MNIYTVNAIEADQLKCINVLLQMPKLPSNILHTNNSIQNNYYCNICLKLLLLYFKSKFCLSIFKKK